MLNGTTHQELNEFHQMTEDMATFNSDSMGKDTPEVYVQEIMKAMIPLRYLNEICFDYSETVNGYVVSGYLTVYLKHVDHLMKNLELAIRREAKRRAS
jgi:hypothetical protein